MSTPGGIGVTARTAPSMPTSCATAAAVAGASPVTITVRTPSCDSCLTSGAESGLGGSLKPTSPASFSERSGPNATASTRSPCSSSRRASSAIRSFMSSPALPATRSAITEYAPFVTTLTAPVASRTVAEAHFCDGSNGVKLCRSSCSRSDDGAVAAERTAASTGSAPLVELASAPSCSTCAAVKPSPGTVSATASEFMVSVPVLSAQSTSTPAASSSAESRVGSTPRRPKARAPMVPASVNIDGRATGMEARRAMSTSGTTCTNGIPITNA